MCRGGRTALPSISASGDSLLLAERRFGCGRATRDGAGQLGAGAQTELAIDAAEMRLDRLRTHGSRLVVRGAIRNDEGDLQLLGCELVSRRRLARAGALAAGSELRPSPLRPRLGSQVLERRHRLAQPVP